MPTIILYRWRVWDPLRSRWRTTGYLATEEQIRQTHERYEVVQETREVREVDPGQPLTAGHLQRGYGKKE